MSITQYYTGTDKAVSQKIHDTFPDAARFIETCWELDEQGGADISRDKTLHFWLYPCRRSPDTSRAFAVLNEIVDQVPGSIIYLEEACRKFIARLPNINPDRPFTDTIIQKIWRRETMRHVLLRELEKSCEQAINPSFGFDDDLADFGGGGGGGGPSNKISNIVHAAGGKSSGGNG